MNSSSGPWPILDSSRSQRVPVDAFSSSNSTKASTSHSVIARLERKRSCKLFFCEAPIAHCRGSSSHSIKNSKSFSDRSVLSEAFACRSCFAGACDFSYVGVSDLLFISLMIASRKCLYRCGIVSCGLGSTPRKSPVSSFRSRIAGNEDVASCASCSNNGMFAGVSLILARLNSGTKGACI
ncbi:MAG: hypothetical protein DDT29_00893 [Dehalococcoidia bacterium]|nr:hypothetical protein [Bacillota bacterium]